jgi:hypothetical protein
MSEETTLEVDVEVPARYHPRVTSGIMIKIVREGRTSLARARDLSMAGLFLLGLRAKEGERLVLTVPLPGDGEVTTYSVVKRQHKDGVAVEFEDLDWDDLFALARYLHPRLP